MGKQMRKRKEIAQKFGCTYCAQKVITNWLKKSGWNFEDFPVIMKQMGVDEVTILDCIDDCTVEGNSNGRNVLFTFETKSFLVITYKHGGYQDRFLINKNDGKNIPEAFLQQRDIVNSDGVMLYGYYKQNGFEKKVNLKKDIWLEITIEEPTHERTSEVFVQRNREKIDDYLMSCNPSALIKSGVNDVLKQMIYFLAFSDTEVFNSPLISAKLVYKKNSRIIKLSQISFVYGKLTEYVVAEKDEIFSMSLGGSWEVISNEYVAKFDGRVYSFENFALHIEKITDQSPREIIEKSRKKIKQIRKSVFY